MIDLPLGLTLSFDSLLAFVHELPGDIVLFFFLTRLLPMRHKPAFWAISLSLRAFLTTLGSQILPIVFGQTGGALAGMILILFQIFFLPVLFCPRKTFGKSLLVTAAAAAIQGTLSSICSLLIDGPAQMDATITWDAALAHPAPFIASMIAGPLATACGLSALETFLYRRVPHDVGRHAWPYLATLIVLGLTSTTVVIALSALSSAGLRPNAGLVICVLVLLVASVVLTPVLIASVESFGRQQRAQQRADALSAQLDTMLEGYKDINAEIEDVARLRHDLKNQLATAAALLKKDKRDAAREHLQGTLADLTRACAASSLCPADPDEKGL
ncbi:MAG: hypothetical protein KHY83_03200 [Coriobacteriia bacterium]|nr:hypothetical protein [Coriobacteriia bacterium]MBS5477655.1 hypothetical protein [Coriobacteriia bacterium]